MTITKTPIYKVKLIKSGNIKHNFSDPVDAANIFCKYLQNVDREHFCIALLNSNNDVIGIHTVFVGTIDMCVVSPREIIKVALLANARRLILCHNHPSGNVTPSAEDKDITEVIAKAANLFKIDVLDHVIVGEDGNYFSMQESCMMNSFKDKFKKPRKSKK